MLVLALLALRLLSTVCVHACLYPRAEHAPEPGPHIPWGYSGEHGPLVWAGLPARYGSKENWTECRVGRYQSPIVIYTASSLPIPRGTMSVEVGDVPAGGATLENLGQTLEVPAHEGGLEGALSVRFDGEREVHYELVQFHFHTPSEHRVDEEYYPLEMHLVFRSAEGALAVVGVFFQLGTTPNPLLSGVFANLSIVTSPHTNASTGALPFGPLVSKINSGTATLYTYNGSLTTPPCTEGVRWFVLREPEPVTVELYNAVKGVMKFNARYTQNGPGGENLLEIARRIGERGSRSTKALVMQG